MSANHGGSLDNALEIVRQTAEAGADCIKIQTYTADSLTIDCDREYFRIKGGLWDGYKLYDLYKEAYTPYEWQGLIKEECEKCGIDFLSTPFDRDAVDFLESLGVGAYKIASFKLVDIPLIEYTASKGKLMIISTGMGSIEEIQDAVDACRRAGNERIVLLKCCREYPDSGGIQEEEPSLGVLVLMMRDTAERPEGIEAGTLKLVGASEETIYREFVRLLSDDEEYERMSKASNSYGDGHASERIADIIEKI